MDKIVKETKIALERFAVELDLQPTLSKLHRFVIGNDGFYGVNAARRSDGVTWLQVTHRACMLVNVEITPLTSSSKPEGQWYFEESAKIEFERRIKPQLIAVVSKIREIMAINEKEKEEFVS